MRPVGIILVFMNLLFSIATCALIVVVYSTRANWKHGFDEQKSEVVLASAAYKTEKQSHENDLKSRAEELKSREAAIRALQDAAAAAGAGKAQVEKEFLAYKQAMSKYEVTGDALQAQVAQLGKELESLKAERNKREEVIVRLETEKNAERKDRVEAQVKLASLQSRNERLATDFADLSAKYNVLAKDLQNRGLTPDSILNPAAKPAPANVAGAITNVTGSQAEISIGSDSGLSVGNELLVYRLNDDPSKSLYLGTLKVSRTEPKKAVGYFVAAPTSRVKSPSVGDDVRTSFK